MMMCDFIALVSWKMMVLPWSVRSLGGKVLECLAKWWGTPPRCHSSSVGGAELIVLDNHWSLAGITLRLQVDGVTTTQLPLLKAT